MSCTTHLLVGEAETAVKFIPEAKKLWVTVQQNQSLPYVASLALVDNHSSDGFTLEYRMRQIID